MNKLHRIPFLDKLRPYQKIGARTIERLNGRCLLADPMGVGKTWQVIAYLAMNPDLRPAIVVPPASVKLKWKDEINNLLPDEEVQVISGNKMQDIVGSIVIINYDVLFYSLMIEDKDGKKKKKFYLREELVKHPFKVVIGDEIHKISNSKTGRTKAFKQLCKGKKRIIAVSGTPIESKPINFWNILNIVSPGTFSWYDYTWRYCDRKEGFFGADYSGASNLDELHSKIKPFTIRRKKEDILPELPPKTRIIIPLEISNRKEYDTADNDYLQWLKSKGGNVSSAAKAQALTKMGVLKKLAIKGMLKQAISWIEDYLESGEKLVVGCIHREINETIYAKFKNVSIQFIGGLGEKKKHELNKKFQTDPKIKLAVCSIEAAGEGLDFQAAPATCTIELLWKPTTHFQFEDRVHRIGQASDNVMAYYLVGKDTIMEDIAEILDRKIEIVNQVIDGIETDENELFTELIKRRL